jgi:N-acetylneuraminic acid mutarotase
MFCGSLFTLLIVLILNQLFAQSTDDSDAWHRVASMPTGVFFAAGSQTGNRYVVTGGINTTGQSVAVIQVLDLDTLTWHTGANLPRDRFAHAQATLADGRILIAGGRSGNVTDPHHVQWLCDAWIWDPASDTFTTLPDLGAKSTGPSACTLPNGQTVVIAGMTAYVLSQDGTHWESQITLRTHRANHAAIAVSDHHLLIAGGSGRKSIELVDVTAQTTTMLPPRLPQPTDDLAIAKLDNGQIWITGGQNTLTGHTLSATWQLHLNVTHPDDAYLTPGPLINDPHGVADHQLVQRGNRLMGMGGESESSHFDTELNLAWELNAEQSTLHMLPNLLEPHDDALAVLYHNQWLVIGGYQKKPAFFGVVVIPTATRTVERMVLKE